MWTHVPWQGRFLPHPLPPKERLRAYAGWCTAVEGNTTFYATPARATVEMWAQQVAPDFRFVLKLPKVITHERRLNGAEGDLSEESANYLGRRDQRRCAHHPEKRRQVFLQRRAR